MASQQDDELIAMPERCSANAHVKGMHNYLAMWEKSVDSIDEFWGAQACMPNILSASHDDC
jgi:hypothetical protein